MTELSEAERLEVLGHLRAGSRLQAIVSIRRFTSLGLRDAVALLERVEAEFTPDECYGGDEMGMSARILCIGPFSTSVLEHMEYPPKFYSDTRDGAPILRYLFEVDEGSTRSRELAACFGIEAWNFNDHKLKPEGANTAKLTEMFGANEVRVFEALRDAGFAFYFMPNG